MDFFIDSTGLNNLRDAIKILIDSEIEVILFGVNENVNSDLEKTNIHKMIGKPYTFNIFEIAVEGARKLLLQTKYKSV